MKNTQSIIKNTLLIITIIISTIQAYSQTSLEKDKLNFMLGEWTIDAKIKQNEISYIYGKGTMKMYFNASKDTLFADTNIKFQNFNVTGTTKRTYNNKTQRWDVSWTPTIVGRKAFINIEGKFNGENFVEIDYGKDTYGSYVGRLVNYNISSNHFSVRKDNLYDDGTLMKEVWVFEANKEVSKE